MKAHALGVVLALAAAIQGGAAQQPARQQGGTSQKQEQQAKPVLDPVCGMKVDPARAAGKSQYKGTTYWFCSAHCKKTFDADPEASLRKAAQNQKK